ncbi:MAG TPA: Gfo/Idh/MocA family oxidoreductase [Steroidobacter sp.]
MSAQLHQPASQSARAVRLGFLGLGWIGRKRLDALQGCEEVEIVALHDIDPSRSRAAAEAHPTAQVAQDLDALLARDLDGVVIATPNALHARDAVACLERGIGVFCQKPLATRLEDTRRVIDAARRTNRLLGIDYCYRHVQGMPELKARLGAGELGEIVSIDLTFHNAHAPDKSWCLDRRLSGGGCLLDLGVHLIDLVLWLQDAPDMELVSSQLYAQGPAARTAGAVEDSAYVELRQANGAIVRVACSWNAHIGCDAVISMRMLGTQGGAHWRNVRGSFYDFELEVTRGNTSERLGTYPDDWGGRALKEWARQLRHDRSFDPQTLMIARGAALIEEMYRS